MVISGILLFLSILKCLIDKLDAAERVESPTEPFVYQTLEGFCTGSTDPSRIQSILDCPTVDGEKPTIIK